MPFDDYFGTQFDNEELIRALQQQTDASNALTGGVVGNRRFAFAPGRYPTNPSRFSFAPPLTLQPPNPMPDMPQSPQAQPPYNGGSEFAKNEPYNPFGNRIVNQGSAGRFASPQELNEPDPFQGADNKAPWAFAPYNQSKLDEFLATLPQTEQGRQSEAPFEMSSGREGEFAREMPFDFAKATQGSLDPHSQNLRAQEQAAALRSTLNPFNIVNELMKHGYTPRPQIPISSEEQGGAAQLGDVQGIRNAGAAELTTMAASGLIPRDVLIPPEGLGANIVRNASNRIQPRWPMQVELMRSPDAKAIMESMSNQPISEITKALNDHFQTNPWNKINDVDVANYNRGTLGTEGAWAKDEEASLKNIMSKSDLSEKHTKGRWNDIVGQFREENPNFRGSDEAIRAKMINMMGGRYPSGETTLGANLTSGRRGNPGRPSIFTDRQLQSIQAIKDRLGDNASNKDFVNEFRRIYADHPAKDAAIIGAKNKSISTSTPGSQTIGSDIPTKALASFPQEATPQWVRDWAKKANVDIIKETESGGGTSPTKYIQLKSDISPKPVTVRLPSDEHMGRPVGVGEARFDTGTRPPVGAEGTNQPKFSMERYGRGTINQAGQSYANTEALDMALRGATGKSPGGGFELTSPEYGRYGEKGESFFEPKQRPDRNQLSLFSNQTDPTTANILAILNDKTPMGALKRHLANINPASNPTEGRFLVDPQVHYPVNENTKSIISKIKDLNKDKDPTLFSNQTDPDTAAILKILQSGQPLTGMQRASTGGGTVKPYETLNSYMWNGVNKNWPVLQRTPELLSKYSDPVKYDLALERQKLKKLGYDPDRIDFYHHWKLAHPELYPPE